MIKFKNHALLGRGERRNSMVTKRCSLLISFSIFFILLVTMSLSHGAEMKNIHQNRLQTLLFVPKHELLVGDSVSGLRGSIRFWSLKNGQMIDALDLGEGELSKSLTVSHDGNLLAIALYRNDEIGCYSIKDKKWLWKVKWEGKIRYSYNLRFTPDDHAIVMQGLDKIITYDVKSGNILRHLDDKYGFSGGFPAYKTRFSALSPSASYAVMWQGNLEHDETLSWNPNVWVIVWDLGKGQIISRQEKIQAKYKNCSAVFTSDEKKVLLGSMDGFIREWSISEQKTVKEWKAYAVGKTPTNEKQYTSPSQIDSMILSSNGQYIAMLGSELKIGFTVRIFDYKNMTLIREFANVNSKNTMCSGYPMAFSSDNKYFALENKGMLCLYDVATWNEKWCVTSAH
jgi:WD40 repeat protein